MIPNLPLWISLMFIATVVLAILLFHFANGRSVKLTAATILWTIIQSVISYSGYYANDTSLPPRFLIVLLPVVLLIGYGLTSKPLNWIISRRDLSISAFLHTVRIPVEITLYYLYMYQWIPELMTFEGRNFDIIAGMTAPIIGWLWIKKKISRQALLYWNIIALGLVLFIFFNGILSSELPIQQFGFEQPNIAVTYFPFVLLPATVVPIVIYTHITDIIKLRRMQ